MSSPTQLKIDISCPNPDRLDSDTELNASSPVPYDVYNKMFLLEPQKFRTKE